MTHVTRVVTVGGGPGGYEAALVAAQLGATVTVVDRDGVGGSAVLTDCVPSKTLIATADVMTDVEESAELGLRFHFGDGAGAPRNAISVDLKMVNDRVKRLAREQSEDIAGRLRREGVELVQGAGRLDGPQAVVARFDDGSEQRYDADVVLLATGAHPRILPTARPDGERILTWE
jgi:NAD(P)H dehydrogenase (quinone)